MKPSLFPKGGRLAALLLLLLLPAPRPVAAHTLLPPQSAATEKSHTVLLLETMAVPVIENHAEAIRAGFAEAGFREGKDLEIRRFNARGDRRAAGDFLRRSLAAEPPDLVITLATLASQVASEVLAGSGIPQIFCVVADPVGAGLVAAVGRPTGRPLTGRVHSIDRHTKIDLVMSLVGSVAPGRPVRFGVLHSSYPSARGDLAALKAVAAERGDLVFVPREIPYQKGRDGFTAMLAEVHRAIPELEEDIDFWWEPTGPLGEVAAYHRLLAQSSRPVALGNTIESVAGGALLTVSPDSRAAGREVAALAGKILHGSDAGALAVAPPGDFVLGLNLRTALELGVVIPSTLLEIADHVYR